MQSSREDFLPIRARGVCCISSKFPYAPLRIKKAWTPTVQPLRGLLILYVPVQFGLILSATIIAHDFGKRKRVREILVKT